MKNLVQNILPLVLLTALAALLAGCQGGADQVGTADTKNGTAAKAGPAPKDAAKKPAAAPAAGEKTTGTPPKEVAGTAPGAQTPTEPVAAAPTDPAADPAKVGPWDIKVVFKKGETHQYKMKSDVSVSYSMGEGQTMPPQNMSEELTLSVKAVEANPNKAKLTYTLTPKAPKQKDPSSQTEQQQPVTLNVEVDNKGNTKLLTTAQDPQNASLAQMPLAAIHAPGKPVKVNDKWTAQVPHPLKAVPQLAMLGVKVSDNLKLHYKLLGVTDKGLKIRATGGDKVTMKVEKGQQGSPGPGKLDMTLQFTMDYVVDPKNGQVLSSQSVTTSRSKGEQTMADGKTMKISSDSRAKVTLTRTK